MKGWGVAPTSSPSSSSLTSTPCPVSRWPIRSVSLRNTRSHHGQMYTCTAWGLLSNENRGGSKLVSIDPFYIFINCMAGKCSLPGPNGHLHERSINVFSVFSTFWRHPNRFSKHRPEDKREPIIFVKRSRRLGHLLGNYLYTDRTGTIFIAWIWGYADMIFFLEPGISFLLF